MNTIIKRVWNKNRMTNIEGLSGMTFQSESGGHTFEISGIDDQNNAVALSGTVAGIFMRPDNADIALTGTASDGVVSVTLTEDCYAVAGRFGLTIFVTDENDHKVAVYAAIGTVTRTSGGAVAGDTPQDVVDLINAINAAVATIPADYTDLMVTIAPTYSNTALYNEGSYVWYDGKLYRCISPITTAESWTASHWQAAVLTTDLSETAHVIVSDTAKEIKYARADLTAGMIQPNGTVTSSTAVGYPSTPFPVDPYDVMTVKIYYQNNNGYLVGTNGSFRMCALFTDDPTTYIGRGYTSQQSSVTIPSDIHYAQPSISSIMSGTYNVAIIYLTKKNGRTDRYVVQNGYESPVQFIGHVDASTRHLIGDLLSVDDYILTATLKVGETFNGFTIGATNNAGSSITRPYVKVTATNVEMKSGTASSYDQDVSHGLTIHDDLQVFVIQKKNSLNAQVILQSGGQRYTSPTTWRFGSVYQRFGFYTYNATDVSASVSVTDLSKPVWVCGDSWVTNYDSRWYGQALTLGIVNFLKSGHSGEGSKDGLDHLKTLLKMTTPKMILWLYGMNDSDTNNSTPNAEWLAALNELKTICRDRFIDLVLATVPTTPHINNNAKNAVVKASGYRYVDQESAVGADTSGNWISGYQSDDGNHPTEAGARALLAQFLADAPEIAFS